MLREPRNSINNNTLLLFFYNLIGFVCKMQFAVYTYLTIIFVCLLLYP